jgi:hypothetical protein
LSVKTVCIVAIVAFMCVVGDRAAPQGAKTTVTDDYNAFSELRFNVSNPDFGLADVSNVVAGPQLAPPRQFRVVVP